MNNSNNKKALNLLLKKLVNHHDSLATQFDLKTLKRINNYLNRQEENKRDIEIRKPAKTKPFSWRNYFNIHDNYSYGDNHTSNHHKQKAIAQVMYQLISRYIDSSHYRSNDNENIVISKRLVRCFGFAEATVISIIANKFANLYNLWLKGYSINDIKIQTKQMSGVWINVSKREIYKVSGALSTDIINKACNKLKNQGLALQIGNYWFLNIQQINYIVSKIELPTD